MITWSLTKEVSSDTMTASGLLDTSQQVFYNDEMVDLSTPPLDYFTMGPVQDEPYKVVVESAASKTPWRVHGFIAGAKSSHTSFQGQKIHAPLEEEYRNFHVNPTITSTGQRINTGNLIVGVGHADKRLKGDRAREWYQTVAQLTEGSAGIVADVRAQVIPEVGIFVTGALREEVSKAQIRALNSSSVSGDWRAFFNEAGRKVKEMVAVIATGLPGFNVPAVGEALVASGFTLEEVKASATDHEGSQVYFEDGEVQTIIWSEDFEPVTHDTRIDALEAEVAALGAYIRKMQMRELLD